MTKYIINRCHAYKQYSGEGFILSGSEHPSSPWKAKPEEAASPCSFSQLRHWLTTSGQKHSPETRNEEQVAQRWGREAPSLGRRSSGVSPGSSGGTEWYHWQAVGHAKAAMLAGGSAFQISFTADFGACVLHVDPNTWFSSPPRDSLCYAQILSINSLLLIKSAQVTFCCLQRTWLMKPPRD